MLFWVNVTIVFCVVWALSHFLANVFVCSPVSAQYNLQDAATGTCGNQNTLFQSLVITNIIGDIIIMVLPMRESLPLFIIIGRPRLTSCRYDLELEHAKDGEAWSVRFLLAPWKV